MFNYKLVASGQPRPYADSQFVYDIETDLPEKEAENECLKQISNLPKHEGEYFYSSYYEFRAVASSPSLSRYQFIIITPYCD